jgi:mevalonate kinase
VNHELLKVRTPAKLILSGEHAVVHGYPALAIAVNRYMEATARWATPLHFSFNFMGIDFRRRVTLQALRKLKHKVTQQFHQYRSGHLSIRQVLEKPFELSLFAFINVLDRLKNKLPTGIDITTDSNIPIGCGMGSSAASVVSLTYALSEFLKINLSIDDYIKLGIESENLQHGFSSGLDVHTVYHGGCLRFEKGEKQFRQITTLPMQLIQTGQPQSTTGECVAHTASYFKNSEIGADFAAITNALDQALQNQQINTAKDCIRENQKLLHKIGVVPNKVNDFIVDIEKMGVAAKICGAGSIRGDHGGVILALSEDDLSPIAAKYGYIVTPIQIDTRGTRVISS